MKRKFIFVFYIIILLISIICFISCGKFVFLDCANIIRAGYTEEIGLGMALILFVLLVIHIPPFIAEFITFCRSSVSMDEK